MRDESRRRSSPCRRSGLPCRAERQLRDRSSGGLTDDEGDCARDVGRGQGEDHNREKVEAICEGQRAGLVDPSLEAEDVLSLVTSMSMAWSPASPLIAASRDDAGELHERRREALRTAVRRAFSIGQ